MNFLKRLLVYRRVGYMADHKKRRGGIPVDFSSSHRKQRGRTAPNRAWKKRRRIVINAII